MKWILIFSIVTMTSSFAQPRISMTLSQFKGKAQPYVQFWTGGTPGSGSGLDLFIPMKTEKAENVDAVYFRGMVIDKVDPLKDEDFLIAARFQTDFNKKPSISTNENIIDDKRKSKKKKSTKFPFDLKDDEAVLKIAANGRYTYVKITGIETRDAQDLPSRPQ